MPLVHGHYAFLTRDKIEPTIHQVSGLINDFLVDGILPTCFLGGT